MRGVLGAHKLASRKRIAEIFEVGLVGKARHLMVRMLPRDEGPAFVSIAIGKRLGGAVARNRIRRRVRAAAMAVVGEWPAGDYVIQPRQSALECPFGEIGANLQKARSALRAEKPSTI